jgi:tetratricopeptide (TPR) repeat protein
MMSERPHGDDAFQQRLTALWNYQDPAGTEVAFRSLLPEVERSGDAGALAELQTQIARTFSLRRRFDEAHATLDAIDHTVLAAQPRARVRYLLERGRTFNTAGDRDAATEQFRLAWEAARRSGEDGLAVDAAHMLGIVLPGDEGLRWNLEALTLARSSPLPDAQRWQGSLLNNIGWAQHDAGRYDEALATFEEGLTWHQAAGSPRETRIAGWTIGRTLRSLGRYKEALEVQQRLAEAGESDGYVDEELGENLLALGREDEARAAFARAYALLSKDPWLSTDEPERLKRLAELGEASP